PPAPSRDQRRNPRRDRPPGNDATRLSNARRRERIDARRAPRVPPRRRTVPALRYRDREDACRRPRHLVLPELPAEPDLVACRRHRRGPPYWAPPPPAPPPLPG